MAKGKKAGDGHRLMKVPPIKDRIEALEASVVVLNNTLEKFQETLLKVSTAYNSLMRATNSASAVLVAIEQHLDETTDKKWDKGKRKEIEARLELMEKRKILWTKSASRNLRPIDSVLLAEELWEIARQIGTEAKDASAVLHQYLKGGRIDRAAEVIKQIRDRKIVLHKDVEPLVREFEKRVEAELAKKNDLDAPKTEEPPKENEVEPAPPDPKLAAAADSLDDEPENAV